MVNPPNGFVPGRCYYDAKGNVDSPRVMVCTKSVLYGLQLKPYTGTLKLAISCEANEVRAGHWVDCTEQVKRSEAMQNCVACPLVPITKDFVGTVISFPEGKQMAAPHFLYAYEHEMAFLMTLDGKDRVFNLHLESCYPLQQVYQDIAERAMAADPLRSSLFDSFFKWLRKTPQYRKFVTTVEGVAPESREDMIRLFELLSYEGVTASTFEEEVQKRYQALQENARRGVSPYTAVLDAYQGPAQNYTKVEREVMRATGFRYATPKEAWAAEGGGKPFPQTVSQVDVREPLTPHQYICNTIGLYDGNDTGFWFAKLCPTLSRFPDMETEYQEAVQAYVDAVPAFDQAQLNFIVEEDKAAVFRDLLGVPSLDLKDPFRAWIRNPPEEFQRYRKAHATLSYPEIFYELYQQKRP